MPEAKTNCTTCGCQILQTTAGRNGGLCAVCLRKSKTKDRVDPALHPPRPLTRQLLDQWIHNAEPQHAIINTLFNRACWKVNFAPRNLTDGETIVYTVWTFLGETCNGGVKQFFGNQSGSLVHRCAPSLRRIGAIKYAVLIEEAIQEFTAAQSEDDPQWGEDLNAYEDEHEAPFSELDHRFFELYHANEEELPDLLFDFIASNRDMFCD